MSANSARIVTADGVEIDVVRHAADGPERGTVLAAHGLSQDMDEGGMYVRLADRLTDAGFDVVRFSYRGHGDSEGSPQGVTIAGERLDFERAFEHTRERFDSPYFVVAKSFGAVSTCLSLPRFEATISGLVLWNPVLDVEGTFLNPSVPWGIRNFGGEQLTDVREKGSLSIDGGFDVGHVLYEELHRYDPGARFRESPVPALVIHGDGDDIVPYEDARRVAERKGADFHTIPDADHGFLAPDDPTAEDTREQDDRTVAWLLDSTDA